MCSEEAICNKIGFDISVESLFASWFMQYNHNVGNLDYLNSESVFISTHCVQRIVYVHIDLKAATETLPQF